MLRRDEYKFLFYTERLKKLINGELIAPVTVELGLTERCQHSCNFCAFEWMMDRKTDLDYNSVIAAIGNMANMGVKGVTLCGNGEPLLYPHFEEVVTLIIDEGMAVGMATNGALLDRHDYKLFMPFTYIRISLDAGDESTYNKVHGKNDFLRVMDNIRRLVKFRNIHKQGITIGVHYTLSVDNFSSMYKALKLCKEIGIDYFHVGPIVQATQSTGELPGSIILNLKEIEELKAKSTDSFQIFVSENRFDDVSGRDDTTSGFDQCRAQNYFCVIDAHGNVSPCCHLFGNEKYFIGNIKTQFFDELWYSERHKEIITGIDFKDCAVSCNKKECNRMLHSLFNVHLHPAFVG